MLAEIKNPIHLTNREKEIFLLLKQGLKNCEIANQLFISTKTVEAHKSNLNLKLNLKNTNELMLFSVNFSCEVIKEN